MFGALKHRNFRLFFFGQGISLIGTWMQQVAMIWLVYRLTNSAFLLGLVGFCSQIPAFFLAPVAGVFIDRWNLHRTIVITQSLAMCQAWCSAEPRHEQRPKLQTLHASLTAWQNTRFHSCSVACGIGVSPRIGKVGLSLAPTIRNAFVLWKSTRKDSLINSPAQFLSSSAVAALNLKHLVSAALELVFYTLNRPAVASLAEGIAYGGDVA